jgi:hypothetical protein
MIWFDLLEEQGSCLDYMILLLWRKRIHARLHDVVALEEQDPCSAHMIWLLWRNRIHAQTIYVH